MRASASCVGSQHWRSPPGEPDDYRILSNGKGGHLHLAKAVDGWLVPGKTRSASIFISRMSMPWPPSSKTSFGASAVPRVNRGERTNSLCPIPTKRLFALVGRHACEADPRQHASRLGPKTLTSVRR